MLLITLIAPLELGARKKVGLRFCTAAIFAPKLTLPLNVAHIMDNINNGLLHRAFSVFLFTPDGKLLLQQVIGATVVELCIVWPYVLHVLDTMQRAGSKITFPFIWANTCCSHPLAVPSEIIEADALGVKNAARRKLQHELGIPPEDVPLSDFTWVTRVHYVGASGAGPWGEHEVDWILLCAPKMMPRLELNPNEVSQVRWAVAAGVLAALLLTDSPSTACRCALSRSLSCVSGCAPGHSTATQYRLGLMSWSLVDCCTSG